MEVLEDLLCRARAHGSVFATSTLRGPWGLAFDGDVRLSLHAVLAGEAWCDVAGGAPVRARAGDVLLLRGGEPFAVRASPDVVAEPLADVLRRTGSTGRRLCLPGDEPATEVVCGSYTFPGVLCDELVASLSPVALVADGDPSVHGAVALLRTELQNARSGSQMVLDRLLDVLLVACLRVLWAASPRPPVWAGVPQDAAVGQALRAVHADPAHPWTVAQLARTAGLSRAAFARRFAAEVGVPPLTYLTGWRMGLAREALLEDDATLASVARHVGYATEYAFAAAFKREVGQAPGRWREAMRRPPRRTSDGGPLELPARARVE